MDLCQQGALDNGGLPTGMAPTLNKNNIKFGGILGIQENFTGVLGVLLKSCSYMILILEGILALIDLV